MTKRHAQQQKFLKDGLNLRFPQGDIGIQLSDLYSAQEILQKCVK